MIIRYCLTCIFLCVIYITNAQQPAEINAEADSLLLAGNYFEAAMQYERVLFSTDDSACAYHAVMGKVGCLKQQHLFDEAVKFISANRRTDLNDSLNYALNYEQITCAYLGGNFENALALIEQTRLNYPGLSADISLDALKVLSLNELRKWDEAALAYNSFLSKAGISQDAEWLYKKIPSLKSEDKASWLSTFIPGGGQFYAGKPLEGLLSILIQGAGIYYGIVSFQEGYYLSAWLAGAGIFGSFHMGGVRRSEALVNQYNTRKAYEFNQKVREQIIKEIQ